MDMLINDTDRTRATGNGRAKPRMRRGAILRDRDHAFISFDGCQRGFREK
jgi:hypothetical protein